MEQGALRSTSLWKALTYTFPVRRLRAKPSARKPPPSNSSDDGSGVTADVPVTDPPVRSPFTDRGLLISKKKLPLKPVPPVIGKEPVQNIPSDAVQVPVPPGLKIWSPMNTHSKSPPPGNASRENNPPTKEGAKPREASDEKPVKVGEENVTSMLLMKFTPPGSIEHAGVEDDEHGEGTVNSKVNDAPGAETGLVEVSDAYVLVTVYVTPSARALRALMPTANPKIAKIVSSFRIFQIPPAALNRGRN
jgi:hypothetical protein